MKRGEPPKRRTPLKRGKPPKRKAGGNVRGTTSYESEFRRQRPKVFERCRGRCEVGVPGVCTRVAVHVHHRRTRAQGGSNELDNLLGVCWACHSHVHNHPALSYEQGWMERRT